MAERHVRFSAGLLLIGLGIALSVWICWPLPKYVTSAIPYTFSAKPDERVAGMIQGDHLQYLYHLNLLRAAVDGQIPPFRDPNQFSGPYHWNTPYVYFPFAFLYLPFSYISPALGYNVLVLLSFVATMIAGYGLAKAWGASPASAICAGIVLTLFPYRLNSLFGGHAAGSSFFLFPMAWWGLEKNWQTRRAGWGILAGLSFMVMSLQDIHFLFFFCLLLPFWAVWKLFEEKAFVLPEATRGERLALTSLLTWQGIAAATLLAASSHYHQARMRAVPLVSPAFFGLLIFFILAVVVVNGLAGAILRWLGLTDARFRRRWLSWPWAAFGVMVAYFAVGFVNKPGFGSKIVLAAVALFGLCHLGFLVRAIQKGKDAGETPALQRKLSPGKIRIPWGRVLRLWPSAAGLALALVYPVYLKFFVFAGTTVAGGRAMFEVALFSIPWRDFFVRAAEGGKYIGWGFGCITLVGLIAMVLLKKKPQPDEERRPHLLISLAIALLGMILACGVLLGHVFPLYNVLYRFVPFLSFIRSTSKYLILTATGGAVALSLILTSLGGTGRRGAIGKSLPVLAAIVLILDYGLISMTGVSVLTRQSAIYEHVKTQGKRTRLLELPIWPGDSGFSSPYLYATMLTGVPTINGYSPMAPAGYKENIANLLDPVNLGVFGQKEFNLLRELNVRFVTFHEELFPRQVSALPATHSLKKLLMNPNLEHVRSEDRTHLFRIVTGAFQDVSASPFMELSSMSFYAPYDILKHEVGEGREDSEASTGKAWHSDGRESFLFFGPFLMLPPGEYMALFRVRVQAPPGAKEVGYLDVYTAEGSEKLTHYPLRPDEWPIPYAYRLVKIPFRVTQPYPVQTRGFFHGAKNATVALDFVMIQPQGLEEDIRLEAEDFFSKAGRVARDDKATQGICLETSGSPPDGEPVLEEAFVYLTAGRYQVHCVARGAGETIATLRLRRVGRSSGRQDFDIRGGESEEAFETSTGALNLAAGGVYGISLWPARGNLKSVDYISFSLDSAP